MRNAFVSLLAAAALAAAVCATQGLAGSGSRYHQVRTGVTLHVDTSACAGFAPAGKLLLAARLNAAYVVWKTPTGNAQVGRTDVRASARVDGHTYRITQRYVFAPRQSREYVDGWATTVVARDDGATMTGASWLGFGGADAPVEGVWWQGTPSCRLSTN